jgi:hypothetical protein
LSAKVNKSSVNSRSDKKRSGKIRICPFCKKPTLRPADSISGWMTADIFACTNCGYRGHLCIEVDPEEFERYQKQSSEDENEEE